MGTIDPSSFMQGASGKIGNIVLYTVDGKTHFRLRSQAHSDARTPKQLLQRYRLLSAQTMFQSVKKCILYEVFNTAAARQRRRSGYHLFLKLNTNAFGENDYVDYSLLRFSEGGLQLPFDFRVAGYRNGKAELTWNNNPEQATAAGTDRLLAAAVLAGEPFRVVMLTGVDALRKDGYAAIPLEKEGRGDIHLYCFFASEDMKSFSQDRYFHIKR